MKPLGCLLVLILLGFSVGAQQSSPPSKAIAPSAPSSPSTQAPTGSSPEFLRAADQVLAQMSQLLDLPIKEPLKKSLRSKQQIREYLVQEEKEDKDEDKRDADAKTIEAFGLSLIHI